MLARGRRVQPRVFGQKSTAFGKGLVDAGLQLDVPRHLCVLGNGLVAFFVADKVAGHGAFFHANPVKINRRCVDFGTFAGGLLGHFKHVFGQARVDGAVVVGVLSVAADDASVVGLSGGWWRKGGRCAGLSTDDKDWPSPCASADCSGKLGPQARAAAAARLALLD